MQPWYAPPAQQKLYTSYTNTDTSLHSPPPCGAAPGGPGKQPGQNSQLLFKPFMASGQTTSKTIKAIWQCFVGAPSTQAMWLDTQPIWLSCSSTAEFHVARHLGWIVRNTHWNKGATQLRCSTRMPLTVLLQAVPPSSLHPPKHCSRGPLRAATTAVRTAAATACLAQGS